MAHMMVDQHFMNLPEAMIPVGGARVQSLADPVGDIEVRFSALFWSEVQVPAAVVVLVGHDAVLPGSCDDAWFDAMPRRCLGIRDQHFFSLATTGWSRWLMAMVWMTCDLFPL